MNCARVGFNYRDSNICVKHVLLPKYLHLWFLFLAMVCTWFCVFVLRVLDGVTYVVSIIENHTLAAFGCLQTILVCVCAHSGMALCQETISLVVETLFDAKSNRQHQIGQKHDGSDQRHETGGTQQVQSERNNRTDIDENDQWHYYTSRLFAKRSNDTEHNHNN